MNGAIALVGSGEFTPALESVDRELLVATGRARPRVAIVPTASVPDGEAVFLRWAEMGRQHFSALGAEVEPVLIRDRDAAQDPANAQAIGEADLIYLSGGKPDFLYDVLAGSAVEAALHEAHARGAVLAGCSAGAMVLADRRFAARRRIPFPPRWLPAFGLVPRAAVAPHYDAIPEVLMAALILRAPRGGVVLGGGDAAWTRRGVRVPSQQRATQVFKQLFVKGTPEEEARAMRRIRDDQSILDDLREQVKTLNGKLGEADRARLDLYLASIREAEQRLQQDEKWSKTPKPEVKVATPVADFGGPQLLQRSKQWFELVQLALKLVF
jgi:peptidase E